MMDRSLLLIQRALQFTSHSFDANKGKACIILQFGFYLSPMVHILSGKCLTNEYAYMKVVESTFPLPPFHYSMGFKKDIEAIRAASEIQRQST